MNLNLLKAGDTIQKGIDELLGLFNESHQFDHLTFNFANLLFERGVKDQALTFYNRYLETFPLNHQAWKRKSECLRDLGKEVAADRSLKRANQILTGEDK